VRAILDVGANQGNWGIDAARRHPGIPVFAFEPTPLLCNLIRQKVRDLSLPNYELIPAAVSDTASRMDFNVAGLGDWGCSSLLPFNDGLEATWPGRGDFRVTEVIQVECIRLDQFVEQRGITSVEFLHCDTQGTDLKVLASLGKHLGIVQMGEIETASSNSVAIYKGQHTIEDVVLFFLKHGLEIDSLAPNDPQCNEMNVIFKKRAF
jgi:FkbM family methyltransferase